MHPAQDDNLGTEPLLIAGIPSKPSEQREIDEQRNVPAGKRCHGKDKGRVYAAEKGREARIQSGEKPVAREHRPALLLRGVARLAITRRVRFIGGRLEGEQGISRAIEIGSDLVLQVESA